MLTSLKIMCGKEVVAEVLDPKVIFADGVKRHIIERLPKSLPEFARWVEDRVVPNDRVDIEDVLSLMSLKEYDFFAMAQKTRANLMEDDFWVKFEDDDSWQDNLKARAGYKPTPRKYIFNK